MSSTRPMAPKNRNSGIATHSNRRRLRECMARAPALLGGLAGQGEPIAPAAQRLDRLQLVLRIELASQPADQHFDDVAVSLEVLVIEALGQLGLGDDVTRAQHQVLEDAVLES